MKQIPYFKLGLIVFAGIAIFLITSTIYDAINGDMSPSRWTILKYAIITVFSVGIVLGARKIINIIKTQLGV